MILTSYFTTKVSHLGPRFEGESFLYSFVRAPTLTTNHNYSDVVKPQFHRQMNNILIFYIFIIKTKN